MAKVNITLSIDKDVHTEFKIESIRNSMNMSEGIENFMLSYVKLSKQLREERIVKHDNIESYERAGEEEE